MACGCCPAAGTGGANSYERHGYTTIAPGWPDDPDTVAEAREHPEVFAKTSLKIIAAHYAEAIRALTIEPVLVGHSFGGMLAEELAGEGLSAATVAIDPAPFRGVLPVPASSLKSSAAVLNNPANYARAVSLSFDQFKYGWANGTRRDRSARALRGVPRSWFRAATVLGGVREHQPVDRGPASDTTNPDRGPMLLISGEKDNTVPWALVSAAYQRQLRNPGETEIRQIPDRGHSLVIDHGWQDIAECALASSRSTYRRSSPSTADLPPSTGASPLAPVPPGAASRSTCYTPPA